MPLGCLQVGRRGRDHEFSVCWMCVEIELLGTVSPRHWGSHLHKKLWLPLFLKPGGLVIWMYHQLTLWFECECPPEAQMFEH